MGEKGEYPEFGGHRQIGVSSAASFVGRREVHLVLLKEVNDEWIFAGHVKEADNVLADTILILVDECGHVVVDLARVVNNGKGAIRVRGLLKRFALVCMQLLELLEQGIIRVVQELALVVQNLQEPKGLVNVTLIPVNEIQTLLVVGEADGFPLNALLEVEVLLGLEDAVIKVLLEPFVGQIDAELFKAVGLEVLKTEDVENSNKRSLLRSGGGLVDGVHQEAEEVRINGFADRITHRNSLENMGGLRTPATEQPK